MGTSISGSSMMTRRARWGAPLVLALSCTVPALVAGCRVDDEAVHRWETTERGPEKLVAVLGHDKYETPLRTEAAMSLIRMRPRSGRRIGIELMTDKLSEVAPDVRQRIVDGMAPGLIKEMQVPPPVKAAPGAPTTEDHSIPFKDAAFALLQHDPPLVSSDPTKAALSDALTEWCQNDFETRLENPSQQFGIEQIMRFIGPRSVRGLPALITEQSNKVDRIVGLIADLGEDATKVKGADALVALAKTLDSKAWLDKQTAVVQKADDEQHQKVTKEQLQVQVTKFQDQELTKVFSSMKRLKGRAIVEYLIQYASNASNSGERRKTALAALEGAIDRNNASDVERIFAIARDDNTPDEVRDLAFARLSELPKEQVVPRLYTLFQPKKWKVRWVAATNVLKMITAKPARGDIAEFMSHLPATPKEKMALSEPITYAGFLAKIEAPPGEPKARDAVLAYMSSNLIGPKLTALGLFYNGQEGRSADRPGEVRRQAARPQVRDGRRLRLAVRAAEAGQPPREERDDSSDGSDGGRLCSGLHRPPHGRAVVPGCTDERSGANVA